MGPITKEVNCSLEKDVGTGAIWGAKAGVGLIVVAETMGISNYALETMWRGLGGEPKWPFFNGDCELDQFKEVSMCTDEPIRLGPWMPVIVGGTTALGAAAGGVKHFASKLFF